MQNKLPRFDDPQSLELLAEQALVRMTMAGRLDHRDVGKLPKPLILSVARALLDHKEARASLHRRLCAEHADDIDKALDGRPLSDDVVYSFAEVFHAFALELHRELIGAATAGPMLFTEDEAARRLRVGPAELLALVDAGELAAVQVGPNVRLSREAIDAFLEAHPVRGRDGRYKAKKAPSARRVPSAQPGS